MTAMSDAIPLTMTDLTPIVNKMYAQYKSVQAGRESSALPPSARPRRS